MVMQEGRGKVREGGLEEVNPGLSHNPLSHSFISASLFNETQWKFLMRKHFFAGKKAKCARFSEKQNRKEKVLSELVGGKSCANGDCVGVLSSSFKTQS